MGEVFESITDFLLECFVCSIFCFMIEHFVWNRIYERIRKWIMENSNG